MIAFEHLTANAWDIMAMVGMATTAGLWLWAVKSMVERRTAGNGGSA